MPNFFIFIFSALALLSLLSIYMLITT